MNNSVAIPIYQPFMVGNEKKYVNECLDAQWISSKGKFIAQFENSFAHFVGLPYATAVSNGTTALHLALLALDIGPQDEVIVPTLTYIASANAIKYVGATPVFCDSTRDTWQIDVDAIRHKITNKTRAIMAVHLYGHPCDMEKLQKICREYGLFLIEDCAEALGSFYHTKHVGAWGDVSTFSFYGNKTITTGEGGMVVTHDPAVYEKAVQLKAQGIAKDRTYWHDVLGYNYRMTNICAAIGLAQLENIQTILKMKREIALWYAQALQHLPVELHAEVGDVQHCYWMCSLLTPVAAMRDKLRDYLAAEGIETRPLFYPLHTMPLYSQYTNDAFPIAEDLGARGINLPSWPGLTQAQVQLIAEKIQNFFELERA